MAGNAGSGGSPVIEDGGRRGRRNAVVEANFKATAMGGSDGEGGDLLSQISNYNKDKLRPPPERRRRGGIDLGKQNPGDLQAEIEFFNKSRLKKAESGGSDGRSSPPPEGDEEDGGRGSLLNALRGYDRSRLQRIPKEDDDGKKDKLPSSLTGAYQQMAHIFRCKELGVPVSTKPKILDQLEKDAKRAAKTKKKGKSKAAAGAAAAAAALPPSEGPEAEPEAEEPAGEPASSPSSSPAPSDSDSDSDTDSESGWSTASDFTDSD